MQLWAGTTLILEDDNELAAVLDDGQFALSTRSATIGCDHPALNETLEIRLINLNQPGTVQEPGIEVNFDNVTLTAQPAASAVPAASTWSTIVMTLLIMATASVLWRNAPLADSSSPSV